ncbi:EFR1 family ferrodoxin [Faecalispora anaeroviscerum]|uniref:EFR1 family ferrodoxin n=1 Tax=Faecalispora anaeroviscerum TaxID=2991836 RepID=UPI0024B90FE3|nr:EFR1 family ferrodoxin [Faecalispora anaeroviscerum]
MSKINHVKAVFFSATGTTEKTVMQIAVAAAGKLGLPVSTVDFTLPSGRECPLVFQEDDLVVFGTPVYAGRVPNVLLKFLDTLQGNRALAVPVVLFGNRNYDDALIELRDLLHKAGFQPMAAAAFVGEHSFSRILAAGRPDAEDLSKAAHFGERVAEKLLSGEDSSLIEVKGVAHPYRGYYQPRDRKGTPVDIRKVKPQTGPSCNDCKLCAEICPMGSISQENVHEYIGICIKCGACIKKCPQGAKYYTDEGYLYHQHELEEGLTRRAEPELFL